MAREIMNPTTNERGEESHLPVTDLVVENHGSIYLLRPKTQAAREWLHEHAPEDAQWFGLALVVEHRYVNDWCMHALDAGLKVA